MRETGMTGSKKNTNGVLIQADTPTVSSSNYPKVKTVVLKMSILLNQVWDPGVLG